jgi:hypothetical protein
MGKLMGAAMIISFGPAAWAEAFHSFSKLASGLTEYALSSFTRVLVAYRHRATEGVLTGPLTTVSEKP